MVPSLSLRKVKSHDDRLERLLSNCIKNYKELETQNH